MSEDETTDELETADDDESGGDPGDEEDAPSSEDGDELDADGDDESPDGDGESDGEAGVPGGEGDEDGGEPAELITVKVDGEEKQLTLDELKKGYSHHAAATKRMQEAAEARKEVEAEHAKAKEAMAEAKKHVDLANKWYEALLDDPIETFKAAAKAQGFDDEQIFQSVKSYVAKKVSELNELDKNPAERRAMSAESQAAENKRRLEEYERRERERQLAEQEQVELEKIDAETEEALTGAGLEKDDDSKAQVFQLIVAAAEQGKDLTAKDAVAKLKTKLEEKRRQAIQGLTVEELEAQYPELAAQLQKRSLDKVKAQKAGKARANPTRASATNPTPKREKPAKFKTWEDKFGSVIG